METTAKALVEHWDWAAGKGLMNKNTALGLRAACSQVLSVLDNWESVDVKTLNLDNTLTRFQNLKKKDFKPAVLETYKRRFKSAVSSYLAYLDDPGGWKPKTIERVSKPERVSKADNPDPSPTSQSLANDAPRSSFMEYPYPLREGQFIARLLLPRDLKLSEVKRLTAFMNTLTVDFE